jgi:hypothetical protein
MRGRLHERGWPTAAGLDRPFVGHDVLLPRPSPAGPTATSSGLASAPGLGQVLTRPGLRGTDGWVRSSAWHCALSSQHLGHRARGALILGPVGVSKTHLVTALEHIAVRRRRTVRFLRDDQM